MSNRTPRQRRGQATAVLVAEYLQSVAPGCYATPSSQMGNDLQNCPWDVEVKAPRDKYMAPKAWAKQARARRRPEHILPPMVVWRPDGLGEENVGDFLVIRNFADDRALLEELLQLRFLAEEFKRELGELRAQGQ